MRTKTIDNPRNDCQLKNNVCNLEQSVSLEHFAEAVLSVSLLLVESGAHCERINRNVQRMAQNTDFEVEIFISFTGVSVSVTEKPKPENTITKHRRIKHHAAHFGVLTNTSLLTWKLADREIGICEFTSSLDGLKSTPKHPIAVVRLFIGIACACLCLLVGGDFIDALFAFFASLLGLIVRQEMVGKGFNLMIAVLSSAFVTTTISGINVLNGWGSFPDSSVATAVLFLIPGVPLINCIIDLIEGYIPMGIARGAFGGFILLCIAVGMFLSMSLIGINYF